MGQKGSGAGQAEEVAHLPVARPVTDPDDDQAGFLRGQIGEMDGRPVGEQHGQAVARLQAAGGEHRGQRGGALVVLGPGQRRGAGGVGDGRRPALGVEGDAVGEGIGAPPSGGPIGLDRLVLGPNRHRSPLSCSMSTVRHESASYQRRQSQSPGPSGWGDRRPAEAH